MAKRIVDTDPFVICGFHKPSRTDFERRFWSKVVKSEDGCWEWTARRLDHGYGLFTVARGEQRLAHRVSWELAHGPIPEGMKVLHDCDNPRCVRPDHLFLGTSKDNTQDMLAKGRHAHGERHPHTNLTERDVLEIRRLRHDTELSYRKIGALFGIRAEAAWKIAQHKRWTHI